VQTVASAVRVQQGETFLPALHRVYPALTVRLAYEREQRHLHPSAKNLPALPHGVQVRIGYLDAGGVSRLLVYALIDESTRCVYTLTPPKHPAACPSWDFLNTSTGLYVAGGRQVPESATAQ
jgi:hypothetical protein